MNVFMITSYNYITFKSHLQQLNKLRRRESCVTVQLNNMNCKTLLYTQNFSYDVFSEK